MKNIYIGIDPGKQGFISIIKDEEYIFFEMPYEKVDGKKVFCERCLKPLVEDLVTICKGYEVKVAIEQVTGRGGWSATNNFNFGYTAGLQKMMMIMLDADILMVRPQKWQSVMRQGYPDIKKSSSTGKTQVRDPKAVAELIVQTEYPDIDFRKSTRARKNDDNKIDAFLIAQYLKRQNGK